MTLHALTVTSTRCLQEKVKKDKQIMILSSVEVLDVWQCKILGLYTHRLYLYLEVNSDCFLPEFVKLVYKTG